LTEEKAALKLKDALLIRCAGVTFANRKGKLRITNHDEQGIELHENFDLESYCQRKLFNQQFGRRFGDGATPRELSNLDEVISLVRQFRAPDFAIARKVGHHWRVKKR